MLTSSLKSLNRSYIQYKIQLTKYKIDKKIRVKSFKCYKKN